MPFCVLFKGREYVHGDFTHAYINIRAVQGHWPLLVILYCTFLSGGLRYEGGMEALKVNALPAMPAAPPPPVVTVRTFFPETWIWELVDVG